MMQNTTQPDKATGAHEVGNSRLIDTLSTPAGYACEMLFTVRRLDGAAGCSGCVPMVILPKSLIGKTVKLTVEECT